MEKKNLLAGNHVFPGYCAARKTAFVASRKAIVRRKSYATLRHTNIKLKIAVYHPDLQVVQVILYYFRRDLYIAIFTSQKIYCWFLFLTGVRLPEIIWISGMWPEILAFFVRTDFMYARKLFEKGLQLQFWIGSFFSYSKLDTTGSKKPEILGTQPDIQVTVHPY